MILSLLFTSTFITLQETGEIDPFDDKFGEDVSTSWEDPSPYIIESDQREENFSEGESDQREENFSEGYYSSSLEYGIKPGRYTVNIEPAGEDITLYLKDGEKTIERNFNETISLETNIDTNSVLIGILIRDPLTFQEHDGESFEIEFVKED